MSSHHFVKEQQEPALILATAEFPEYTFELLEWAPTVIALQEAFNAVLESGIKVDVAIIDSNDDHWREVFSHQQPIKLIQSKDISPMQVAIDHLSAVNHKAVNIIYPDAEALIHSAALAHTAFDLTVYDHHHRYAYIRDGKFRKWLPAGSHIRTMKNAVLPDNNRSLRPEKDGYQVIADGMIYFEADAPFWIVERI